MSRLGNFFRVLVIVLLLWLVLIIVGVWEEL